MANRQDADHKNRPRYSMRWRLVLGLLLPAMIIGLVALSDVHRTIVSTATIVSDNILASTALAISGEMQIDSKGNIHVDVPVVALDMLATVTDGPVYYRVEDAQGNLVVGDKSLLVAAKTATIGEQPIFSDATYQETPIRVVSYTGVVSLANKSAEYRIIVAETSTNRRNLTLKFLGRTVGRFLLIVVSAITVVCFAVSLALRPVNRLQKEIDRRSPDDLHSIDQFVPSEIGGLLDTINNFIARLENALSALRNFTGNASHQLRTPLTIIKTQLALATRAKTLEEARAAAREGDSAVIHAERILSQLLLMARVDQESSHQPHISRIDLSEIAKRVTSQYLKMAESRDNDLGFHSSGPIYCDANALLIEELLRNLIENAIRYSGPGSEITVRTFSYPGISVLEVEDNGPGIPVEMRMQVRARFSRVAVPSHPTSNSAPLSEDGGAGLGLAIVSEIARLFHGSLDLFNGSDHKGLVARVSFPTKNKSQDTPDQSPSSR